jgi:hypothetical protein
MAEALKFEKTDKLGNPIKRLNAIVGPARPRKQHQVKKKSRVDPNLVVVSSDSGDDDTDYVVTEVATEPEDSEDSASTGWPNEFEEVFPSNNEVRYILFYFICILTQRVGCRHTPSQDNSRGRAQYYSKAHALHGLQDGSEVT